MHDSFLSLRDLNLIILLSIPLHRSFVFLKHVDDFFKLILPLLDAVSGLQHIVSANCGVDRAKVLGLLLPTRTHIAVIGALDLGIGRPHLTIVDHSTVTAVCNSSLEVTTCIEVRMVRITRRYKSPISTEDHLLALEE